MRYYELKPHQNRKLSGCQFRFQGLGIRVKVEQAFVVSRNLMLIIQVQCPPHIELPGHEKFDAGIPGQGTHSL